MSHQTPIQLTEQISDYLLENGLRPGDPLPTEAQFAEILGASKSAVRDAVHRLRGAGVLESRRRAGLKISEGNLFEVLRYRLQVAATARQGLEDLYGMRAIIDVGLAPLLVGRITYSQSAELGDLVNEMGKATNTEDFREIDYSFHARIYAYAGNELLRDFGEVILRLFRESTQPVRQLTPERLTEFVEMHEGIVTAIAHRNAEDLVRAINIHYGGRDLQQILRHLEDIAKPQSE